MGEAEHTFGGDWTERKLDALLYYLQFYTVALKGKTGAKWRFDLWYIDAFAGTGERTAERETGGLFVSAPIGREQVQLDGSAKRALAIQPPFKRVVLIEADAGRFEALCRLQEDPRVLCLRGDANEQLPVIFGGDSWRMPERGKGLQRAVVFLDPYGMQVAWSTLELLAKTRRVDVWYLFPIEAVGRQLAHDLSAVDQWKQARLDAVLGGPEWRTELYEEEIIENDLFSQGGSRKKRKVGRIEIESYFQKKLRALFPFVSEALPLGAGNQQKFSLFLLVANDSDAAINLAKSGVADMLKKQRLAASRRRSDL